MGERGEERGGGVGIGAVQGEGDPVDVRRVEGVQVGFDPGDGGGGIGLGPGGGDAAADILRPLGVGAVLLNHC